MGVIAYEMVMGRRPYLGRTRKEVREDVLQRQARIPAVYGGCSEECKEFVNGVTMLGNVVVGEEAL